MGGWMRSFIRMWDVNFFHQLSTKAKGKICLHICSSSVWIPKTSWSTTRVDLLFCWVWWAFGRLPDNCCLVCCSMECVFLFMPILSISLCILLGHVIFFMLCMKGWFFPATFQCLASLAYPSYSCSIDHKDMWTDTHSLYYTSWWSRKAFYTKRVLPIPDYKPLWICFLSVLSFLKFLN